MLGISFKKTVFISAVMVFVLFLSVVLEAEPLGTEFTYQGRLIDANSPAEGEYDFIFKVYDAQSNGTQAGEDVNIPDVDVIDGYFTVELDFGNVFTGQSLWLEIEVREGDSNDVFTLLSPRQKITALPYALYAASGMEGARIEVGRFDGLVNAGMVETDPGGNTTVNFEKPFMTTEKPQFYVSVVLKQAANGLVEGAAIKAVESIKGSANNWTGFDLDVTKYSDGTYIDDMTQVYVKWIAVSKTAVSSTGSTETDIVTGSIPFDGNPSYIGDVGLVKDVTSEITSGFTLVDVTAKGRKADEMSGEIQDEPPLILYPKVNGTNIELLVWDAAGNEYGTGAPWSGRKAHIEYTLFMKKSGGYLSSGKRVVSGYVAYDSSSLPADFTGLTMPEMEGANSTNTVIIASGSKIDDTTGNRKPLAITGEVTSSTSLDLQIWETNGAPYNVVAWTGNSAIEISYCVVDR
jgi:hypothetical protein